MTSIPEQWRPVVDWEGLYEVSNLGRVRSLPRTTTSGRVLIPMTQPNGYLFVGLYDYQRRAGRLVHRLVGEAFIGPKPRGMVTRHLDGDQTNNRLTNLEYSTQSVNIRDMEQHGTNPQLNKTHCPRGHEYTPENTYTSPGRGRERRCRECGTAARRRRTIRDAEARGGTVQSI
jgi:hypothetical protein